MQATLIFETFLAPVWHKTYMSITEHIERTVQVPTILLAGEALDDFAAGHADVGVMSGLSYMKLSSLQPCPVELIATPIAAGVEEQDAQPAFFHIVAHKDSSLTGIQDLEGCSWASHPRVAHVEDTMMYEPHALELNFETTRETANQAQALRSVLERQADATAIDIRTFAIVLHNSPRMVARLRILGTYCYASTPLVVVAARLPADLKRRLRDAFLRAHLDVMVAHYLQE
ncbi:MAG TPA: PhnD/SsuA/transferrin family substrate-binding protein, partial [Ktedonobacteraceae bacterium]|nr:PhnD/SsuA/transferrin family substrate-binding protein [Ktedonobacteraceae bacterium]